MARSSNLTTREYEIAELIATGATNDQVAEQLIIAAGTVATHVHHILEKLGLHNRQELVIWVLRRETKGTADPSGEKYTDL